MSQSPPSSTTQTGRSALARVLKTDHGWLGTAALGGVAALLAWTTGVSGLAVGVVVLIVGRAVPAPVAWGVGTTALLSVADGAVVTGGVLLLTGVLLGPAVRSPHGRVLAGLSVGVGVVLTVLASLLVTVWPLLWATVILCGGVAASVYLIHRYEQVQLGLVAERETPRL